jgi:hypothetical protein
MTLDTRVYIRDAIDPIEVFDYCNKIIGAGEKIERTTKHPVDAAPGDGNAPLWTFNNPNQGLHALLTVRYRKDGPLLTPEKAAAHEQCGDDCEALHCEREHCWVEVAFETSYGYTGPSGEHCGQYHADLVMQLGHWLTASGCNWRWRDEKTGAVWDRYDHMQDLIDAGADAKQWFTKDVLPKLQERAKATGRPLVRADDLGFEAIA